MNQSVSISVNARAPVAQLVRASDRQSCRKPGFESWHDPKYYQLAIPPFTSHLPHGTINFQHTTDLRTTV